MAQPGMACQPHPMRLKFFSRCHILYTAGPDTQAETRQLNESPPSSVALPGEAQRPHDIIDLRRLVPDLQADLRYYNGNNFLGCRVEGYEADVLLITEKAGRAVAGVQQGLKTQGLGLKVFDAYRPRRAVEQFMAWAADAGENSAKAQYYPHLDKAQIISEGYLIPLSAHSRGSTIDLTLVELESGEELDMGTPFDFFDPVSWPGSRAVSQEQQDNRRLLREAMLAQGFEPLESEWWHFTLKDEPYPDTSFDFPIR